MDNSILSIALWVGAALLLLMFLARRRKRRNLQ
jgi:LPXTG-motif cell wall-anchored protein